MANSAQRDPTQSAVGALADVSDTLSPDLVRAVADRVYALLLADLRLERERRPPSSPFAHSLHRGG